MIKEEKETNQQELNNKQNEVLEKIDIKFILSVVIIVCLILIFIFGYVVYDEINSAKKYCNSLDKVYQLKNLNHLCDNETLYKYSYGNWDFDKSIYLNNTKLNYP